MIKFGKVCTLNRNLKIKIIDIMKVIPSTTLALVLGATQAFSETKVEIVNVKNVMLRIWGQNHNGSYTGIKPLTQDIEGGFEIARDLKYFIHSDSHDYDENRCFDASTLEGRILDKFKKISDETGIEFSKTIEEEEAQLRFHFCDIQKDDLGGFVSNFPDSSGFVDIVIGERSTNKNREDEILSNIWSPTSNAGYITQLLMKPDNTIYDGIIFHEILHSLGQRHTHNSGNQANPNIEDSIDGGCSIMSYDKSKGMKNWGPVDKGAMIASYKYDSALDQSNFDGFSISGNFSQIMFNSDCRSESFEDDSYSNDTINYSSIALQSSVSLILAFFSWLSKETRINQITLDEDQEQIDTMTYLKNYFIKALKHLSTSPTAKKAGDLGKVGFRFIMPIASKTSIIQQSLYDHIIDDIAVKILNNETVDIFNIGSALGQSILKVGSHTLYYAALNSSQNDVANWTIYSVVDVNEIINNFTKEISENKPKSAIDVVESLGYAILNSLPLCRDLCKRSRVLPSDNVDNPTRDLVDEEDDLEKSANMESRSKPTANTGADTAGIVSAEDLELVGVDESIIQPSSTPENSVTQNVGTSRRDNTRSNN